MKDTVPNEIFKGCVPMVSAAPKPTSRSRHHSNMAAYCPMDPNTEKAQARLFVGDNVELAPHSASKQNKGGRLFVGDEVEIAPPPPKQSHAPRHKWYGGTAGVIVSKAAALEDYFWEIEAVVGWRVQANIDEYLIRWKGCPKKEDTWEPAANLCDTACECPSLDVSIYNLVLTFRVICSEGGLEI